MSVENLPTPGSSASAELVLRLLGPTAVRQRGVAVALPRSRKVRALLAFLMLEGRPAALSAM